MPRSDSRQKKYIQISWDEFTALIQAGVIRLSKSPTLGLHQYILFQSQPQENGVHMATLDILTSLQNLTDTQSQTLTV